jgi:hypothetical protein
MFTFLCRRICKYKYTGDSLSLFNFSRINSKNTNFNKGILNSNDNIKENKSSSNKASDKISEDYDLNINKTNLNINIPKTDFKERLNSKKNEIDLISKITQEFYTDQLSLGSNEKKFWVTHDGPSFANGKAHLGLLYNKVLKDTINRLKIMQGYRVNYQIGFDCYGINIEDQVANMLKVINKYK